MKLFLRINIKRLTYDWEFREESQEELIKMRQLVKAAREFKQNDY